jgi:DNA-binding transcriptional LysR family regulator
MSFRHIEAFRAVITTGSMTEASRRLHTSQPQVSRLIAQLEKIAQFALFHRNGSRLTPTPDGMRFYREVEKTFVGLAGLEKAAAEIRSFSASRLSVAAMPRLAGGILARIVARFKLEFPDVLISIHSGDAASVHNWVSSGGCDTGIAMLYDDAPGVHAVPVVTMECVAIVPRGHPLAGKDRLIPADFEGQTFISFPNTSALRRKVDAIFEADQVGRRVAAEASLGASVCALVAAGLGVSLINPLAAAEEQPGAGVEIRPFSPSIPIKLVLLYPQYAPRSRLLDVFSACAEDVIARELAGYAVSPAGR